MRREVREDHALGAVERVDRRLSESLPAGGQYFPDDPRAGKYTRPLPAADLSKYASISSIARIYDSGNIVIYDLEGEPHS